jgi:murein DD-endopeptidase MepM/ murein hydrolase activator NlpD
MLYTYDEYGMLPNPTSTPGHRILLFVRGIQRGVDDVVVWMTTEHSGHFGSIIGLLTHFQVSSLNTQDPKALVAVQQVSSVQLTFLKIYQKLNLYQPKKQPSIMTMTNFFLILTLISATFSCTSAIDYVSAFQGLQSLVVWPILQSSSSSSSSSRQLISSTFGPRLIRKSDDDNHNVLLEFSRGIDIEGEGPIVASYTGTVHRRIRNHDDGSITVILEHSFEEWVQFHSLKGFTKKWFTVYQHLANDAESSVQLQEGDVVRTGDILGEVQQSSQPLHYQVLIGSSCSLHFARSNPASKCNRKGYDPHVHPLLLFPTSTSDDDSDSPQVHLDLQLINQVIPGVQHGIVRLTSDISAANYNRFQIELLDEDGVTTMIKQHTLDLNLRKGFAQDDATPNPMYPYLSPIIVNANSEKWTMELILPNHWGGTTTHPTATTTGTNSYIRVSVYDVHGSLAGEIMV